MTFVPPSSLLPSMALGRPGGAAFDLTLFVRRGSESAFAVVEGRLLDTTALDDLTDSGAGGVEEHRLAGDFHRFGDCAHLEREVHLRLLIHLQDTPARKPSLPAGSPLHKKGDRLRPLRTSFLNPAISAVMVSRRPAMTEWRSISDRSSPRGTRGAGNWPGVSSPPSQRHRAYPTCDNRASAEMAKRGLFITFEGMDGCGKTTQMRRLGKRLRGAGHTVLETVEPGGAAIGLQIRSILLHSANRELSPTTELLLYFAARAQNVDQLILPALGQGRIVLSDRFTDSSLAYQGSGRGLGVETVLALDRIACRG